MATFEDFSARARAAEAGERVPTNAPAASFSERAQAAELGGIPLEPVTPPTMAQPSADQNAIAQLPPDLQRLSPEELTQLGIPWGGGDQPMADLQTQRKSAFQQANTEPGVPLDVDSGVDALLRARLGVQRSKQAQLDILRGLYGNDKVRLSKQGDFIVRTTGEGGKPKDLLVDEQDMSASDLLDLLHEAPALALSMTLGTKGVPVGSILRGAVQGAGAYLGGGALTDLISQSLDPSTKVDAKETAGARGLEFGVNTLGGYAVGKSISSIGTLGKFLRLASDDALPLLSEGASLEARQRVAQARTAVAAGTGVKLEPTAGELTGNPIIQRLEAFFSNIPLARGFILKNVERRMANERAIQTALAGKAGGAIESDPNDVTSLGERVVSAIGGKLQGLEQQSGEMAGALRQEATGTLTDPLAAISGQPLTATSFGSRMIKRGEAQLQSFKDKAADLFGAIRELPQATEPLFDASPIKAQARSLLSDLVKTKDGEIAMSLAPTGVKSVLDDVTQLPAKQSYFDLVKLRDAIYDRVGSPEPISDRASRTLKDIGASITQQLQEQGPKVFSEGLYPLHRVTPKEWQMVLDANQFYRDNVETFYQKGISNMLKPRTESGAIDPERIASQLLAGGKGSVTAYNTFADFFEKGGAVKDMNRMLRDQLIDAGTDKATGLVKLEDMAAGVAKMEPELVQKLYGVAKDKLLTEVQQAQTGLRVFGKVGAIPERGTQAAVEADALKEALAGGTVKSGTLKALASTTAELQRSYTAELAKALPRGDLRLVSLAPEKFVDDFLLAPGTSEKAASNAMQHLLASGDDQLVGDVRRHYLAQLFKSGAAKASGDVQQLVSQQTGSPLRNLDPQRFALTLEDTGVRKRMELVLGKDIANAVQEFGVAMSGRAGKDAAAALTGGLTGGGYSHQLLQLLGGKFGALKALPDLAQYRVMSYLLTHPDSLKGLRTIAGVAGPEEIAKFARRSVLTPEFAQALAADASDPQEAARLTREIKAWAAGKP